AMRCDRDMGRLIESVRTVSGASRLAEGHKDPAIGTEFELLVALAVFSLSIGHPYVAFLVHADAVGKYEQARPEVSQQLARWVEFEDRRQVRIGAAVYTASLRNPYVIVGIDIDRRRRPPGPTLGKLCPTFDHTIRIILGVQRDCR